MRTFHYPGQIYFSIAGLFEPSHMQYEIDRQEDKSGEPSLAQLTEKAIKILNRSPEGYFLLVEGTMLRFPELKEAGTSLLP